MIPIPVPVLFPIPLPILIPIPIPEPLGRIGVSARAPGSGEGLVSRSLGASCWWMKGWERAVRRQRFDSGGSGAFIPPGIIPRARSDPAALRT